MSLILATIGISAAVPVGGRLFTPWYRTTLHPQAPAEDEEDVNDQAILGQQWDLRMSVNPAHWHHELPISGVGDGSTVLTWPRQCSRAAQRGIRRLIHAHGSTRNARVLLLEQLHLTAEHGYSDNDLVAFCCRPKWEVVDPGFDNFFDARLNQERSGQVCWDMTRPRRAFLKYARCCFPILRGLLASEPPAWLRKEIREDIQDAVSLGTLVVNGSLVDRGGRGDWCKVRVDKKGVSACEGRTWGSNDFGGLAVSPPAMKIHWVVSSLDVAHALGGWVDGYQMPIPAIEFFVSGAYMDDKTSLIGPVLTTSKTPSGRGYIRVPRFCLSWMDRFVTRELVPVFKSRPELMDWRAKENRMVWRGSYTLSQTKCTCRGVMPSASDDEIKMLESQCSCEFEEMETYQNSSRNPDRLCDHVRCRAVELSHQFPDDFDFRFSWNKPVHPIKRQDMDRWMAIMELEQMLAYKYVLDVEGSYMSTMRPYWLLLSKQLIFRQVSTLRIFAYHDALRPFEHYIPVREDLSDLRDKLAWARVHAEQCERIVNTAWEFGRQYFSREYGMYFIHVIARELALATARHKATRDR